MNFTDRNENRKDDVREQSEKSSSGSFCSGGCSEPEGMSRILCF